MKVIIVKLKEVMTCDILPVAMFRAANGESGFNVTGSQLYKLQLSKLTQRFNKFQN